MPRLRPTMFATLLGLASAATTAGAEEPRSLLTIPAHGDTVRSVAFSPDGKTLATGGYDATARTWSLPSGKLEGTWPFPLAKRVEGTFGGHARNVLCVAFSPDGKTLAAAGVDSVRAWDLDTRQLRFAVDRKNVLSVAFSPDGTALAVGGQDGGLALILDAATGAEVARLEGLPGDDVVFSAAYSPDGKALAVVSQDMETDYGLDGTAVRKGNGTTVTLWTLSPGSKPAVARRFEKIVDTLWQVAFSPDGGTLAAAAEDEAVRLWALPGGVEKPPLRGHADVVHGVAFSPDGKAIASASMDGKVFLWDAATGRKRSTLEGHTQAVKCVAFSPDGKLVASGSWDGTARVWDVSGDR